MPQAAVKKVASVINPAPQKILARITVEHTYNCAMACVNYLSVRKGPNNEYPAPEELKEHKDEIIKEFLHWLGKGLAGAQHSHYTVIPFFVFHDNVKGDRADKDNPFTDTSAFMHYLYDNQEKYGCRVAMSHMADNHYHSPLGSHPGRVFILTPPGHQVFETGRKVPVEYHKGIKSCLAGYSQSMHPEDVKTLKGLV